MTTSIEWTRNEDGTPGKAWNPLRGCSRASKGCQNCYAERVAHRFSGPGLPYEGLTRKTRAGRIQWTGEVRLVPEKLGEPLKWRKATRVFVNSMSDLFHESVPFEYVAAVFGVMAAAPRHTFLCLTKRPKRALAFFEWLNDDPEQSPESRCIMEANDRSVVAWDSHSDLPAWPLSNVWLGVSCEDQATADERIPQLLQCPAAARWASLEPLLGPIDLRQDRQRLLGELGGAPGVDRATHAELLNWVVCGAESGPGARVFDIAWACSLRDQCAEAGTPFFLKQLGKRPVWSPGNPRGEQLSFRDPKGGEAGEWPEDLRVRQYPKEVHDA